MNRFKEYMVEKNDILGKEADKIDSTVDKDQKVQKISDLYGKIEATLNSKKDQLINIMKSVGNKYRGVEYKARIKSLDSIISKIVNRGRKLSEIADLIGGMIIAQNSEDSKKIVKDFIRKNGSIVTNTDEKKLGDNPSGYFGAFHLDVDLGGVLGEVQIMHKSLEKQKTLAHSVYASTRDSGATKQDQDLSRKLFVKGNQPVRKEDYQLIIESLEDYLEFLEGL